MCHTRGDFYRRKTQQQKAMTIKRADDNLATDGLAGLFKDESCPNSTVYAEVIGNLDAEGNFHDGLSRTHFEQLHTKFIASGFTAHKAEGTATTPWSRQSEWHQRVEYTASANFTDPCQNDVRISYNGTDPIDATCQREVGVGAKLFFTCASIGNTVAFIRVVRARQAEARPTDGKIRYKVVQIQNVREFTRQSTSFSHISFKYRFIVEWKAGCLRDAYAAKPVYRLQVHTHVAATELSDSLLMSGKSDSFTSDAAKIDWLQNNFKAKIQDVCFATQNSLQQCEEPVQKKQSTDKKSKNKKSGGCHSEDEPFAGGADDDMMLVPEHDDGENETECFDDADDGCGDGDDYM